MRNFSCYFSSGVRTVEKAALSERETERGSASLARLRDNFHVLPLPASGKRETTGREGACSTSSAQSPCQGTSAPTPWQREEAEGLMGCSGNLDVN